MRIFLAEDNEDNYLIVKSNLKKVEEPVELLWAQDGEIGIEMLEHEDDIDLFLVDIEMPKIGGLDLTVWIREQQRFADKPIIAVTASVFAEMKKMYLEKGFNFILEKPFSRKEFLEILQKAMNVS
ncbi:response regulator [Sulfurimonas sp.]|jgi:CheY-like chemotaxis protein|uniref:response regulator n=1 Tax=Sulfurimonas sp. TaxID=2022749 RepID=UPI0025CF0710|nr:response regulator [Sulfurimonas sp.]MCK9473988.1 response regulator [Sulfurimonas sp.]